MVELSDAQKQSLLKQVEFYLSDSNLPKDKFLKEKIAENPEGYVELAVVCAFSRMREILKLPKDTVPSKVSAEVVAAAAQVLQTSSLIDVNAEGTKIKRKEALRDPEVIAKEIDSRSLYASPFPMDANVDKLTEFFGQHAKVNCVRIRRHAASKSFKGSIFVEFADEDSMAKVSTMKLEYEGAELQLEKKLEYVSRKATERKEKGKEGADSDEDLAESHAPAAASKGKKRAAEAGIEPPGKAAKAEDQAEAEGAADQEDGDEEDAKPSFTPGCLVQFSMEADLPESMHARSLVELVGGKEKVRYLELNEDRRTGYLRYKEPEMAAQALQEFVQKSEDQQTMAGTKATWRAVDGDEELEYYQRMIKQASKSDKGGGRGRGGRGGGNRGGGRGGRRGGGRGRGGRGRH